MKAYHQTAYGSLYHGDCLQVMKQFEDKSFNLCLTDPPYGIGASNYSRGNTQYGKSMAVCKNYDKFDWDKSPISDLHIKQILSSAQNHIIFGGNYFNLPPSPCWIVWDKDNGSNNYADCELAWTSFKTAVRLFKFKWHGMLQENMKEKEIRFHPTQKPVALFGWCLNNYSKENDLILDPFAGSGTTAIACIRYKRRYIIIEKEEKYCEIAAKRINTELEQTDFLREL